MTQPRRADPAQRGGLDFAAIAQVALAHAPSLARRWLPDGRTQGDEYMARNPRRVDRNPGSFKVNLATGRWADFAVGASGGDLISLAAYLFAIGQGEAAKRVADMVGVRHD